MSVRDVADMLALAREGLVAAAQQSDEQLRRDSVRLVAKAVSHPEAGVFLSALQEALADFIEKPYGNDPDLDENEGGVLDPYAADVPDEQPDEGVDEDSPASSPAYEGITDGEDDGTDTDVNQNEDPDEAGNDEDDQELEEEEMEGAAYKLAANFRRLFHPFAEV